MGTGVTRQAVTKHLHVRGGAGLVRSARRPRPRLADQWDEALGRLKASLER